MTKQVSEYLFEEFLSIHTKATTEDLYLEFSTKMVLPVSLDFLSHKTLFQIFTHKSFHHEMNRKFEHNERLEFLGDAVLELIVTEFILKKYPELNEGELSKFRSSLVNENSLYKLAMTLNLGSSILLGKGELKSEGQKKPSILSDTFEAMLGGIYLECGLERTKEVFHLCTDQFRRINKKDFYDLKSVVKFDAKTKLQEIVMKKYKVHPKYECEQIEAEGKFLIHFKVNGKTIASKTSISKKKGMQELATTILENNILENKRIDKDTETLCY